MHVFNFCLFLSFELRAFDPNLLIRIIINNLYLFNEIIYYRHMYTCVRLVRLFSNLFDHVLYFHTVRCCVRMAYLKRNLSLTQRLYQCFIEEACKRDYTTRDMP